MQNTAQNRYIGASHFFLAIGVLILIGLIMVSLSGALTQAIFNISPSELGSIPLDKFTSKQSFALKFGHSFTAISFLLTGIVCSLIFNVRFTEFAGLQTKINVKLIGLSLLLFLASLPVISWLVDFNANIQLPHEMQTYFQSMEKTSDSFYSSLMKYNTGIHFILNLFLISALTAIGEEIFFRGILMRVLTKWTKNIHIGIFLSSLIFALIHFQPYKLAPMVVLAMLFGYIYYRSGSLWIPILLHALNNSLVVFADWMSKKGNNIELLSNDYTIGTTYLISSLVIAIGIGYVLWKNSKHTDFNYD